MHRRAFVHSITLGSGVTLGSVVVAWPRKARAQPSARARRVAWLGLGPPPNDAPSREIPEILTRALAERGWIDGQNVVYDFVYAHGKAENLPKLAGDLLHRKADVIVTSGTTAIRAAKDATSTVPIVMAGAGDPVGTGLIQSLARPGGNITGISLVGAELMEKNLELVKQVVPSVRTVTMIRAAANPANRFFFDLMDAAARKLSIRLVSVDIREPDELEPAFARITSDAVFMLLDPMFLPHRRRIAELAIKRKLPLVMGERSYAEAGVLVTYGAGIREVMQASAVYVDKILRGAKPADLPVDQPSKLDLVVNLKTARAIGLTIPPAVLLRADRVIE